MKKTIDRTGFWEGLGERGSKWESVCRIRIYEKGDQAVVVTAEVADAVAYTNWGGISSSNSVEYLAQMICETFGLNPAQLTWIEQYPFNAVNPSALPAPEFSLVRFTYDSRTGRLSQPSWKYLTRIDAVTFTGDDTL